MATIISAKAYANNEVAHLAWTVDPDPIPGCLGFSIMREYLDDTGAVVEQRPLASYVAFKGQSNPDWQAQNTTVWPVQKFWWRDLTLRKKRNGAARRPDRVRVQYCIRAVGKMQPGREPVVVVPESHYDKPTHTWIPNTYQGTPIPLGYLTPEKRTNPVEVTSSYPPFTSTFTNGILSTQFLVRVLEEDGKIQPGELEARLRKPGDWLRNYLSGDVLPLITEFFDQPGGRFLAALYELEDEQLIGLLEANAERLDLILSDAGSGPDPNAPQNAQGKRPTIYDTRNAEARAELRRLANKPGTRFKMYDRMFNGSGHIGHNKFVVHVDDAGKADSVLTGSTNWTWSGVAGQSNNCIRIDDPVVARAYHNYWSDLRADEQPMPDPLNSRAVGAGQKNPLKESDRTAVQAGLATGGSLEVWFSPNMPSPVKKFSSPPDMERLFSLIRKAKRSIFFAVFMPSQGGLNSIVSEAVNLGMKDTSLEVIGAISDTQAMWGYEPSKTAGGKKLPAWSPHVFQHAGVSVVRATALTDDEIGRDLGNFRIDEKLTVGRAIIHDKIVVVDPLDPEACVVAFGSHNLGYKASRENDENLVIVCGHQGLALAYAVHVMDVYDHYRFRAVEAELSAQKTAGGAGQAAGGAGTGPATTRWDGFLDTTDSWQKKASRRLAEYFAS